MKRIAGVLIVALALIVLTEGCKRQIKITRTDTETTGHVVIAVDECFAPVIEEQLAVFTGLNPEATIDPLYVGEKELFDLFMSDSIRLIVSAKDINRYQRDSIAKMKLKPRSQILARDGIALIINKSNTDSLINVETIRKIMTGEISNWSEVSTAGKSRLGKIQVVFDKPNSSTLRYVVDSIANKKPLSTELRGMQDNKAVIDFVAKTPNAMGIIGVNWISNMREESQLEFNESIRVMSVGVENAVTEENTYKPYPAYLSNGNYPLTRDVFIILTDYRGTLTAGFVKFAAGDAGQRIILRAGLVPGTRPTREVMIKNDFN